MTDRPDIPPCAGTNRSGSPCTSRARLGSRYCARHTDQRPELPVQYLVERLSARTRRARRIHLAYAAPAAGFSSTLLCTGTIARTPLRYDPTLTLCKACHRFAADAVARGEVEPDHLRRWNLGEPNVDEVRS